ncbi:MAG: GyrI-like domain-containing protein [Hyphomicrobiales bacterium]|nr:GyrI-like domain-containing protein [Hyphomicrobiales bacterium]MDE1973811.1 GyrI-like domain-containing protein [Hyphomicrobiales bacterium]MDE2285850.1 GyrI-like domain-containing protein [Hyphomicrobiales bacterium]MDE2373914.1 GyrI-like domain-containing protein [Hyphomicrobiales bacterium]
MFRRFALGIALAAAAFTAAAGQTSQAQKTAPAAPSPIDKPNAVPAAPAAATAQPGDPFGEDTTLTAKPMVYVKGTGNWDNAFETITKSLKTVKAYVDKEGLKADGQPMTLFTATDDTGFQYQAAIPVAEPPKTPPHGDIMVGMSPAGHALKFVHRGSYDGLDNTYEAITNYLDEHRLEAKDMFIEQYQTDPVTTNEDHLVVNVYVMVK